MGSTELDPAQINPSVGEARTLYVPSLQLQVNGIDSWFLQGLLQLFCIFTSRGTGDWQSTSARPSPQ
jgi:hypothetical protein